MIKAEIRFTTLQKNGNQDNHTFFAKNFKGLTFANKGNILTLEDGNKIYKYKNAIYESIETKYKKK